ncbi:MAG: hypothetical protein HY910_03460 [Desulfarculus sp.]|nr:hypothetical protein [Desulfarculus sp.]
MEHAPADLSLSAPLDMAFLPVATGFAEQAALGLGLGRAEAMKLTLASEEVFSYLCRVSPPGQGVLLKAQGRLYCVHLSFVFQTRHLDLRLLNLTASPSLEDQADLDELGLLLASRSVERFSVQDQDEQGLRLLLIKDKAYPADEEPPPPPPPFAGPLAVGPAQDGDLLLLARMLRGQAEPCPHDFTIPGKLMDMGASGEYGVLVARDRQGNLGGAMLWRYLAETSFWTTSGGSTVTCFGPYLFGQPAGSTLAADLVEACLGRLAKSDALGLLCTMPTSSLPREYFEKLGTLNFRDGQGQDRELAMYYRELREDPGASLWASPEVIPFLEEQYRRLAFARRLRPASHQGERRPEHSVLASRFNRSQGQAVMHPVWDGQDLAANLERHLRAFLGEGLANIFCEMDLAHAWQAACAPSLLDLGFTPRLVLPHAGQGDLLLWQYAGEPAL